MSRPVLVMIHGLMGSLRYFDPSSRMGNMEVRTPDLLGYGSAAGPTRTSLSLQQQADHVAQTIERIESDPVWLLGHSMGGSIVMMLADQHPELVCGLLNIEGNFTLQDAFWSSAIARQSREQWAEKYRAMQDNVEGWLTRGGIEPTPQRIRWATQIFSHQPADTVHAMSQAILAETADPRYRSAVERVAGSAMPVHLIAGQRSYADWDVPTFVGHAARSFAVIPDAGHLMMLEHPDAFCRAVTQAVRGEST